MRVSVVIPNYNGRHLLEKHLPAVFACLRNGDEVIVVDDASADGSVKFLQRTYPLVHVVAHRNTLRYAQSCNDGVAAAKNPLIFLLNNDVSPESNTLQAAVSHFSHKIVGAIGCLEYDASGKVQGRSVASFQRGMFVHAREKEQTAGPTMWAAGGSMVMRADLWKKLGGMDTLFRPAYYEDIDLGYRTWKAGYGVFFDPSSRVFHDHETTNTSVFGKTQIEVMSHKNAFLFIWKNVTDTRILLHHFLWLPYHVIFGGFRSRGLLIAGLFQAVLQMGEVLRARKIGEKTAKLTDQNTIQMLKKSAL